MLWQKIEQMHVVVSFSFFNLKHQVLITLI